MKPDSIVTEALKRFKECEDRESENRKRAEEAIEFRAGKQWPDAIKAAREDPYQEGGAQPCPVLDKTNQYVRQVINEERINTPRLKFRPVDDVADPAVAEVYDGIARHIQDTSNAVHAYTTAGEHAADGGFGYFRLLTEYCDPESFDQDIVIKRIHNRFSVQLGPHTDPTGADAKYGFVYENMTKEDFEKKYPKKSPANWQTASKENPDWFGEDSVRVAEYIKIVEETQTIVLLSDQSVMPKNQYEKESKAALAVGMLDVPHVLKERSSIKKRVKWYKISASEVLEEGELLGTLMPIIQVVGEELVMPDGSVRRSGMIEPAMDPQRLHNYAHACFIENVALAPRAPFVGFAGQTAGFENLWKVANRKNISFLPVNPVQGENGETLELPQRQPMAQVPTGWQQMLMNTEHGIEATLGMYGPSVGGPSRERSGVALEGQKEQGQMGNLHYPDNLARSILQGGRVMLEWIPKIYDTARVARILGEDDSIDTAHLNPDQESAVEDRTDGLGQVIGKSFNLNIGKYDVTVSTGPAYQTKRQEAAAQMTDVLKSKPELMQIIGDLVFRNLDWPGADKIADRLKSMLPPQIQALENDKDKPMDPKVRALMTQVEQGMQMVQQKAQELAAVQQEVQGESAKLQGEKKSLDADKKILDFSKKLMETDAKRIEAELRAAEMEVENARKLLAEEARCAQAEIATSIEQGRSQNLEQENKGMQTNHQQNMEMLSERLNQMGEVLQGLMQNISALSKPRRKMVTVKRQPTGELLGEVQEVD